MLDQLVLNKTLELAAKELQLEDKQQITKWES